MHLPACESKEKREIRIFTRQTHSDHEKTKRSRLAKKTTRKQESKQVSQKRNTNKAPRERKKNETRPPAAAAWSSLTSSAPNHNYYLAPARPHVHLVGSRHMHSKLRIGATFSAPRVLARLRTHAAQVMAGCAPPLVCRCWLG